MLGNWDTVLVVQIFIWLIVLFEWKRIKNGTKVDRMAFASILFLAVLMSFFNLESLPGPITFLQYIFDPLGKVME